ncbi:MAG: hypothetical protein KKF06_03915 [Candidatus Margulisbacteria bacterium]|nr:hypothetical protein [Candidatus Margulisiibacteriota bacterium]MBU1866899.1 hypothetical protein [Candidatus Margulisiibacteriota bacterium]
MLNSWTSVGTIPRVVKRELVIEVPTAGGIIVEADTDGIVVAGALGWLFCPPQVEPQAARVVAPAKSNDLVIKRGRVMVSFMFAPVLLK